MKRNSPDDITTREIEVVLEQFSIHGNFSIVRYGSGHIHDTYRVDMTHSSNASIYIVQRINDVVFSRIPELIKNIQLTTTHIRSKFKGQDTKNIKRCTLQLHSTKEGKYYYLDTKGNYWRVCDFIPDALTYDVVLDEQHAYQAGEAFAQFQMLLTDLPSSSLTETIPFFHHTPSRFNSLEKAASSDPLNRTTSCLKDIEFVLARQDMIDIVSKELETGKLPLRITHNDTKINNVLIDTKTHRAVCVIDLDTVMSGSVLYDFGDQIRTTAGQFTENEKDLSKVCVNLNVYEQLANGYLSVANKFLIDREIELLSFSGRLMTFTIGVRFLADYLQGDLYFKASYPEENLDRARAQFAFVRSIEKNMEAMQTIIAKYVKR